MAIVISPPNKLVLKDLERFREHVKKYREQNEEGYDEDAKELSRLVEKIHFKFADLIEEYANAGQNLTATFLLTTLSIVYRNDDTTLISAGKLTALASSGIIEIITTAAVGALMGEDPNKSGKPH